MDDYGDSLENYTFLWRTYQSWFVSTSTYGGLADWAAAEVI